MILSEFDEKIKGLSVNENGVRACVRGHIQDFGRTGEIQP